MKAALFINLVFLIQCSESSAQWRIVNQSEPVALGAGAVFVERSITGPENAKISLVIFDAANFKLKVFVQEPPQLKAKKIAGVLRDAHAVAGVNGGYFDMLNFGAAGLEIASGRENGVLEKNNPHEGSFVVRNGIPSLVLRDEFKDKSGVTEMVQCSPVLVRNGEAVGGFGDEQSYGLPRTFFATDGEGKWVMGVCRKIKLSNLALMLASQKVVTEFKIHRALNLDGGPSSGLWCRDVDGKEHSDAEGTLVRNIIALMPMK